MPNRLIFKTLSDIVDIVSGTKFYANVHFHTKESLGTVQIYEDKEHICGTCNNKTENTLIAQAYLWPDSDELKSECDEIINRAKGLVK